METANSIAGDPPRLEVDARDSSGITMPGREILLDRDGRFQTDVLPGLYTLRLTGALSTPLPNNSDKPPSTMLHLLAKQDVEVNGKDIYGITLLIPPPITITGRAYMEDATETKVSQGHVYNPAGGSRCYRFSTKCGHSARWYFYFHEL